MKHHVFIQAFSIAMKQWRVAAIVYGCQFALALTLGMQAHSVLESSIGNSLEINKLMSNYDHTVMTDFLKIHGASITPLIGQLRWLLLVWLVFSVFMNAGLLSTVVKPNNNHVSGTVKAFWMAGATYFLPFLKIGLFFLGMALFWTILLLAPVAYFLEPSLQYFSSEKYVVWFVVCMLGLYLMGLAFLFLWSILSRLYKVQTDARISNCLHHGRSILWQKKGTYLTLLLGYVVVQVVLLLWYWLLDEGIGMHSSGSILLLFLIQQAFTFFRVQLRQMMYAGAVMLAPSPS